MSLSTVFCQSHLRQQKCSVLGLDTDIKVYQDRKWYWESFPRLSSNPENRDVSHVLTNKLPEFDGPAIIDSIEHFIQNIQYYSFYDIHINDWNFCAGWRGEMKRTQGYKIRVENTETHFLFVEGDRVDPETRVTLHPGENWIGYFLIQTQNPLTAFPKSVLDQLTSIKAENWSMFYDEIGERWISRDNPPPKMEYGKMYKVESISATDLTFQWDNPMVSELLASELNTEHFSFDDKSSYESIFIMNILDDDGIMEVGVFAGDVCVGASVFTQSYPFEILVYTDMRHIEEELTFEIYSGQRSENRRYRVVEKRDSLTGEFNSAILRPHRNRYTVITLGSSDQQGFEPQPEPVLILFQNNPHPFHPGKNERKKFTEIGFYIFDDSHVELKVFDLKGKKVAKIFTGELTAGKHSISWNATNNRDETVSSGIYFYRLISNGHAETRKMMILR